jgi:dihydropteroate synthase
VFNARVVELFTEERAKKELEEMGVSPEGANIMAPKALHVLVRLEDVGAKEALILKQEMLSVGGEAAVAMGVDDLSAEKTDALLMGTVKQLKMLAKELSMKPHECPAIAEEIEGTLESYSTSEFDLGIREGQLKIDRPLVMGVVNVTPDSFSDGGKFLDPEAAIVQAKRLVEQGADLLDIGGESSRPGSDSLPAKEELERILPVIEGVVGEVRVPISVDTCKPEVAGKVLDMGAHIINDITGLADPDLAGIVAEHGAGIVIMHMQGTPSTMQKDPRYDDVVADIMRFLRERIALAEEKGIARESIMIDPGIGFGKTAEHNLEITCRLKEFKSIGLPVLIGMSRKSFIGKVLDREVEDRLSGGLAMLSMSIQNGASIIRTHDVKESVDAAKMTWAALSSTR